MSMQENAPSLPAMTVVRLEVDSFKRLHAAHVTPSPTGLVLVRGKNAAGKSSLIESMLDALGVEKADLPITEGEHAGAVKVHLSNGNPEEDLLVEEKITRDSAGKAKRALSITAADGSKKKGPAGVLKSLRGHFADPVAFLDAPAAEQVKTVLKTLGLDEELVVLEGAAEGLYDRRRDLGRDVDRLAKALAEIQSEVEGLPVPPTEGTIDELATELQRIKDHNAGIETLWKAMDVANSRGGLVVGRQEYWTKQAEEARTEVEKAMSEIETFREEWKAAAEAVKGKAIEDPEPIVERMRAHEEAAKHAGRRELLESTRVQYNQAHNLHDGAQSELSETRELIATLLGNATFPVEGMAYDHEAKVITIGGIPFSQASQAERLRAAAAVAMSGSPTIRVMFAREGSLLDEESRVQLATLAEASKFQLWLEVVDSEREGSGVWIDEGEAFQNEPVAPAAPEA